MKVGLTMYDPSRFGIPGPGASAGALLLILLSISSSSVPSHAQSTGTAGSEIQAGHGNHGFEIEDRDGKFLIQIQPRLQFRFVAETQGDTVLVDHNADGPSFAVNRARLKIGGHAYSRELTYFFEYELQGNAMLDFRAQYALSSWANVKVGQWKVHYNRERVISSGQQQMMDRSLINPMFTIDRQQGMSLYGRLDGGGALDVNYWATIATGTGRAGGPNDDRHPLYMGRLQWNVFNGPIAFQGSDLSLVTEPALLLAFAGVTNRSPYTSFSQDGGGNLPGFESGTPGRYRVNQWVAESAFTYKGIAWQQEFHWKEIEDKSVNRATTMVGNYAQVGAILGALSPRLPKELELALRHAFYDPDRHLESDLLQEISFTANWFIKKHLNKVSAEILYLTGEQSGRSDRSSVDFRLQWDISM